MLASEGVIFKQAYTSSPVCSPSRASLISGQYPHNHGVLINTHIAPAWTGGLGENKITFITTLQWLSLDHESISRVQICLRKMYRAVWKDRLEKACLMDLFIFMDAKVQILP